MTNRASVMAYVRPSYWAETWEADKRIPRARAGNRRRIALWSIDRSRLISGLGIGDPSFDTDQGKAVVPSVDPGWYGVNIS
jgi:hypothetical protein